MLCSHEYAAEAVVNRADLFALLNAEADGLGHAGGVEVPAYVWATTIQARASLSKQKSAGRAQVPSGGVGLIFGSLVCSTRCVEEASPTAL